MWTRRLVYRKECLKTTWLFRLAVVVAVLVTGGLTRRIWIPGIAQSLVCVEDGGRADAILVDNLELNYLVFERASELQRAGSAERILVPTGTSGDLEEPGIVTTGIVQLMAGVARLEHWETVPIRETEPISLNAAYQIRDALVQRHINSIVVVTPGFRSRRSSLVYGPVLARAGIQVSCVPVFGQKTPRNWTNTWHGIQDVGEQFLKLQYYRFYVLPVRLGNVSHRRDS
jgi:hypothetical protein